MKEQEHTIARSVIERVRDGTLPGQSCANCGSLDTQLLSFHAVCNRRTRRLDPDDRRRLRISALVLVLSFLLGGIYFFAVVGAMVLLRLLLKKPRDLVEGEELVVPVPIRLCTPCHGIIDGDTSEKVAVFVYQGLSVVGVVLLLVSFLSGRVDCVWGYICLGIAVLLKLLVRDLEHRSPHGAKAFVAMVPDYSELLAAYPKTEIWEVLPPALCSAAPQDSGSVGICQRQDLSNFEHPNGPPSPPP